MQSPHSHSQIPQVTSPRPLVKEKSVKPKPILSHLLRIVRLQAVAKEPVSTTHNPAFRFRMNVNEIAANFA